MFIRPRHVRRSSKFTSKLRSSSRRRQEYAASLLSMAVVQGFLAIALELAAVRSFQAVHKQAGDLPLWILLIMPIAFGLAGLVALRACVRNARAWREVWSSRKRPTG